LYRRNKHYYEINIQELPPKATNSPNCCTVVLKFLNI